ncbi:MAG: hypothetical protein HKP61_05450 [Dactylosporangium sp.]|nr:hypothetical protein [Dactylosporangium sp.]NNJ60392.1 hypothetical protein [Dactylosporangium sp.]
MAPTASRTRPRVPVGVFLATGCQPGHGRAPAGRLPSWHGATPVAVAEIIRTYTADGDLIVDLDAHPAVTAAAWFLHRIPATLTTGRDGQRLRALPPPPGEPTPPRDADAAPAGAQAALVLATLPRPDEPDNPTTLARALQRWRTLLSPGGYLIVTPASVEPTAQRPSPRGAVIAAAPAAGLRWHQQLLIVTRLPETEPRAEALAAPVNAVLPDGRHARAHRTPLVFVTAQFPEVTHA